MADRKISDLTALTTPAAGDYLPIVDISEPSNASKNKRITIEELLRGAPDGTAAAPGIAFESDPDSGIYSAGANQVAISTNGTQKLLIDASGNLTVNGRGYVTQGTGTNESFSVGTTSSSTGTNFGTIDVNGNSYSALYFRTADSIRAGLFANGAADIFDVNTQSTTPITFSPNQTERMRLDSSGRLGLGTSSPQDKLAVVGANGNFTEASIRVNGSTGTTNSDSGIRLYANCNTGTKNWLIAANYNTANTLEITPSTANGGATYSTPTAVFTSTGRVGINTTSPGEKLQVDGNGIFKGANSYVGFQNASGTGTGYIQGQSPYLVIAAGSGSSNTIAFYPGVTQAVTIDSSNRLLVGTSDGSGGVSKLVVQGASNGSAVGVAQISYNGLASAGLGAGTDIGYLRFTDQGSNSGVFAQITATADATTGANDYPGRLTFSTTADGASSPTEQLRISSSGLFTAVSIYNNTTANAANVRIRSDGVFERSTSSVKYKTNVEDLQDFYADAILNIRPIWYRSTCPGDDSSHSWWGFLAEEVAEIDPRLVHWKTFEVSYDENGSAVNTPCEPEPDGVAYDRFVPHLLNLIKRQKEQIEAQGTAIAALEARLSALETS